MEYTEGKWEAIRNAVGTHIIQTEYARIGEIDRHFNANLIVTAVNACISVNPDHPMAVAESIKEMYEALEGILGISVECWRKVKRTLAEAEQEIINPCGDPDDPICKDCKD